MLSKGLYLSFTSSFTKTSLFNYPRTSRIISFVLIVLQLSHPFFFCCHLMLSLRYFGGELSFCWTIPSFLLYFNKLPLNSVSLYKSLCTSLFLFVLLCCLYLNYILALLFCQYIFKKYNENY